MKNNIIISLFICLLFASCTVQNEYEIDLSGTWTLRLDSLNLGIEENWTAVDKLYNSSEASNTRGSAAKNYPESIKTVTLPGTLDDAGIGKEIKRKPEMNNAVLASLTRKHEYIGVAWYQKEVEIPESWNGQNISLELERIIWESQLYIDGQLIGTQESLSTPHRFNLNKALSPGKHTLTLRIDNSNKYPNINVTSNKYPDPNNQDLAHAYTNQTQIKWNGVLGNMKLTAANPNKIDNIQVYSDVKNNSLKVTFERNTNNKAELKYEIHSKDGDKIAKGIIKGQSQEIQIQTPKAMQLWDEFNPVLYTIKIFSDENSSSETRFGYRQVSNEDAVLKINNKRVFLRGNLECVIFPLTGHPPLKKEEWAKLISQAKNYGLNHLRFHSWCPPTAAFEAADEAGFYFQVELPHWSLNFGKDSSTTAFLLAESHRILKEYGNHPSFLLMALGNELEGNIALLNSFVADLKNSDNRHLYMTTCYSFQRPLGLVAQEEDDFFVTQTTDKGWVRGQGIFNDKSPCFNEDYTATAEHVPVPIISHEIGQYSVYPDMTEIEKYTGVLSPLNFMAVKNELEEKGLLKLADDFTFASGKLAALLYKEEIERALKTPSFDGFQLLQLQDFPGQGTALVGLLNAFWESKGIISAEEFKQFNSEVVPLIRFEKAVYEEGEKFKAEIEVANFYKEFTDQEISWEIKNEKNEILKSGKSANTNLVIGNNIGLGNIDFNIEIEKAQKLIVSVHIEGTSYKNSWSVWAYPKEVPLESDHILFTQDMNEASKALEDGQTVLFNPDYTQLKGTDGRFGPVFWSPVHFPDRPTSMGLLMDKNHAAFKDFPTDVHTDWQWWDLCVKSKTINCDSLNVKPIVRVIDNFVTNRKLANVFEAKVNKGKLLFCSIDITNDLNVRPVARQLRYSLQKYMESVEFNPENEIKLSDLTLF